MRKLLLYITLILLFLFNGCRKITKENSNLEMFSLYEGLFYTISPPNMPYKYFIFGWREQGNGNFALISKHGKVRLPHKKIILIKFSAKSLNINKNVKLGISIDGKSISIIRITNEFKKFSIPLRKDFSGKILDFTLISPQKIDGKVLLLKDFAFVLEDGSEIKKTLHTKYYLQKEGIKIPYYYSKDDKINFIKLKFVKKNNKKSFFVVTYMFDNTRKTLKKLNITKKRKYNVTIKNLPTIPDKVNSTPIIKLEFAIQGDKKAKIIWENFIVGKEQVKNNREKKFYTKMKPKKIFFIILDAFRFDLIEKTINGTEITPFINKFSKDSFKFLNFFVSAPYTRASVSTIFSGLLPETHGVREKNSQYWTKLPDIVNTFKLNGYRTYVIYGTRVLPVNNLSTHFDEKIYVRNFRKMIARNSSRMRLSLIKKSLRRIAKEKRNTFVYIHLLPPHEPYNPPKPFNTIFIDTRENYNNLFLINKVNYVNYVEQVKQKLLTFLRNAYLNNANYADYLTKEIIMTLKRNKVYDNSLIIVSSDHGEAFFEHRKIGHNSTNYNEMIKVPFLVKFPYQKKGQIIRAYKSNVDILPTLIDLLSLRKPKSKIMYQGNSFKECFFESTCDNDKFIYSRTDDSRYNYSLIWKKYKYINYLGRDELYDLENDPEEKVNIALIYPMITNYLRQKGFEILNENINLRKKYEIPKKNKKLSKEELKHLKSLGYL